MRNTTIAPTRQWEYRTITTTGDDAEKLLNVLGAQGFKIVHVNHQFDGHDDRGGLCFLLLGRRRPLEEAPF